MKLRIRIKDFNGRLEVDGGVVTISGQSDFVVKASEMNNKWGCTGISFYNGTWFGVHMGRRDGWEVQLQTEEYTRIRRVLRDGAGVPVREQYLTRELGWRDMPASRKIDEDALELPLLVEDPEASAILS